MLIGALSLYGFPDGTSSVSGGGSLKTEGNEMTINAPDGSIFQHQAFNVLASETVRFVQPSANSRVLNRILSMNPSVVEGSIVANGKVFFASPGGMIFGESSAVDVGLLHVVGGNISDEGFLNSTYGYEQLTGSIETHGLILAREVILAGSSVVNTGQINTQSGEVALAAGDGVTIQSFDGLLAVEISQGSLVDEVVASDLAGQAVLQSGIIQSSRVKIAADAIEQSGEIKSREIVFSRFSHLDGSKGIHSVNQIELEPRSISNGVYADLSGASNEVAVLQPTGKFDRLSFKSFGSTSIEAAVGSPTGGSVVFLQNGDFKSLGGSLVINSSFAPIFTSSTSTFLAATDGSLEFKNDENPFVYDQAVLFGTNMDSKFLNSQEINGEGWHTLESTLLSLNDLEIGLTPSAILLLAQENPSFTGFSNGLPGVVAIGGFSSTSGTSTPPIPPEAGISSPQTPAPINREGAEPSADPELESFQPQNINGGGLSYEQVKTAMEYGLFSGYSYLIKVKDIDILENQPKGLQEQISDLGGSAALFGGSYDVVQSGNDTSSTSQETSEGGESEEQEESESSASAGSNESSEGKSSSINLSRSVIGAVPFSPISRPVYSPEAAKVLDSALSPQILEDLKKFIR
jgi:filamentous hemagglutinin family protein